MRYKLGIAGLTLLLLILSQRAFIWWLPLVPWLALLLLSIKPHLVAVAWAGLVTILLTGWFGRLPVIIVPMSVSVGLSLVLTWRSAVPANRVLAVAGLGLVAWELIRAIHFYNSTTLVAINAAVRIIGIICLSWWLIHRERRHVA